jgi:rhamnosyltransferase
VAIVAVYKAPQDLFDRIDILLPQVHAVVLVDDGSDSIDFQRASSRPGVHSISLETNGGIARSLNVGVERARSLGAEFVLTLDQDSSVSDGYVSELLATYRNSESAGVPVGFVAPELVGGAPVLREGTTGNGFDIAFDPIQSGLLLPTAVIDEVGDFDERLFIDAVDTDFTVRVRATGKLPIVCKGLELGHSLGELLPITLFGRAVRLRGRTLHVLYHAPFRTYYMVRNSRFLARSRAAAMPPAWWRLRRRKMASMIIGALVLGPQKAAQIRAIRRGRADARAPRLGKISSETAAAIDGRRRSRKPVDG